ncbi:putative UDP-glucuronosyl/UDP-glucosyltransferase, UDP-glycosyltransferase family [Helianthus annuus]|uniref:Glycosyltransferase n=1 Tax=Helianthus annuus TaxID=4232 RepID=A0A251T7D8_HELAN|nr:UDP-glycosyltransferase 88B1 [Helianthus annuus]KAF5770582.1 putative UDP-glucuronosyl/UDP-glucosyltransferase, UDP-glycosyltransferase family [Helianthus annuus]KAJ0465469.1 putative UDP-glucuronosyl/UDP-glucosyltransferase, UDP-glycosyltransferase family [Helianthus annuus]KAJ0470304.1 putative UDP-glucuronosyl/UDP-glucosyltransferase, UDP-glycosyltransferase family [Helianthus annuus]KAJ0487066.1 putative UDP-glucuronosyl/UDP-glucosyltransferase, UDP-glycosyltransferase family [Helianthus
MKSSTVILYPSPGIGHLVSMVEIGKLIHTHHPSLSVVILIIPAHYETGSTGKYINTVSTTTPSITFHHLPAIPLPPDFSSDFEDLAFGIPELYNPVLHDTLVTISQTSTIKAVILDFYVDAAFQVTKSLSLPTYYFYTSGASGLCGFLYSPYAHKTTCKSYKDVNDFLDIPGVPRMHSSYMPTAVSDRESNSYKYFLKSALNMAKSSGVIANSFFELEERAARTLRDGKCIPEGPTPPTYLIGPLLASGEQVDDDDDEHECLKWLKTQPSKSVVFLCFGSMGVFKKQQLKEIAFGLERSGKRFLWVVRNPMITDCEKESSLKEFELEDVLPEGFLTRTRSKGMVVKNWAPQPAILGHESVGGFVSHCGWNSALEAVVCGVPIVAWPLYAEQKMNRVYLVEEIKVALWLEMSADGFVSADAVEETVKQLMDGEEGRAVRERVSEMSGRAKAAVEDGGSSRVDFLKLTRPWTDQ